MISRLRSLPSMGFLLANLALASSFTLSLAPRAIAGPPVPAPPLVPADDAEGAQADEYFRQGKALVKLGRLEEAYKAYLAGYQLKQGYDLAGNLGNVELELGKNRDAAEHLALCVKSFPATGTPRQLEYIKSRLAEARRKVGELVIKVNEPSAEVTIDGRAIGRSPLSDEVFVDPGDRTIEVKLSGYKPARRVLSIAQGQLTQVDVSLKPVPPPAQSPFVPVVDRSALPRPLPKRSSVPVILGVSAAGVGALVGVVAAVTSSSTGRSADARRTSLEDAWGKSACLRPENLASCNALDRAYLSQATLRTVSILGFSVSGVAAAATLVYVLLPGEKPSGPTVQASVGVTPGGAGFGIRGRF